MQKLDGRVLFSAGDVVAFLECEPLTTLALVHLETPLSPDHEQMALIQKMGYTHESGYLERPHRIVQIPNDGDPAQLARQTLDGMHAAPSSSLEEILLGISSLAAGVPEISELDLNPVFGRVRDGSWMPRSSWHKSIGWRFL